MNPLWDKITPCGDSLNFLGEALIVELNVTPTRLDLGSFLDVLDDFLSKQRYVDRERPGERGKVIRGDVTRVSG